jgi:short-subunit dehydrogenase
VAKAGVVALSETLAGELADDGVGVTVLCPTFFKTNIVRAGRFANDDAKKLGEKMMDRAKQSAEEIASSAIASVERGDLYAVPMADGRWMWRIKRATPEGFQTLVRRIQKRFVRPEQS